MSDINQNLLRRCKTMDSEAFNQLFSRYEGYLYRLCYKYLGNKEDALDMMQEIFLKVFRSIQQFEEDRDFLPWLKRIAVNTCLNHHRDEAKARHLSLDLETEAGWSFYESLPADEQVEEQVIGQITAESLREGINLLPPAARMVLVMHYMDGASCQEIAAAMDQPLGTVKNNLFRARAMLKKILDKKGYLEVN